jgi:transposase
MPAVSATSPVADVADPAQLIAQQAERISTLERERDEYRKLVLLLQEENERLKRGLHGQSAERLPPGGAQLSFDLLRMMLDADGAGLPSNDAEPDEQTIPEHKRRKPVRRPFPEHLPRVQFDIVPPEVQRDGLKAFELIGSQTREVLERRTSSTVVVQIVYKKFVRKDRDRQAPTEVLVADPVELPIPRGTAGPGLLAETIVRRWQDHQPLHRQSAMFAREGFELPPSTLCTWHDQLAELAQPLVDAMWRDAFTAPYLCVDATGVLVLAKEKCHSGHFWIVVAPEKHALYRFSKHHDSAAVDNALAGYKGYLVADAHAVYDHLYAGGDVVEVGCWAHARRYWFKTMASDPERAKVALGHIAALFRIERTIADSPRKKREAARNAKSRQIVVRFFDWCDSQVDLVLDESPAATALGYARNQRKALCRFLDDGRLPLTNNISELGLRREVVGRKNWLFVGSEDGARANTTFVSLLASCGLHRIEPLGYMRDLLILLPSWPKARVLELAPAYWKQTLQKPEAEQKLASNIFRQVALAPSS